MAYPADEAPRIDISENPDALARLIETEVRALVSRRDGVIMGPLKGTAKALIDVLALVLAAKFRNQREALEAERAAWIEARANWLKLMGLTEDDLKMATIKEPG